MRKITMGTILNTLCEELGLTPQFDRPIGYAVFKKVMLANDLFTTENAIKIRWEQLLCMGELIKSKGMDKNGNILIVLDLRPVHLKIKEDGLKPSFSLTLSHSAMEESQ